MAPEILILSVFKPQPAEREKDQVILTNIHRQKSVGLDAVHLAVPSPVTSCISLDTATGHINSSIFLKTRQSLNLEREVHFKLLQLLRIKCYGPGQYLAFGNVVLG